MLAADAGAGEPQNGDATYAHKLSRDDGRLDLARPAGEVLAQWAGMTPEPGAFVLFEEQPLKIHELVPFSGAGGEGSLSEGSPGTVALTGGRALLRLSDGALELARVQPAGKPAMDGAAWLRGRGGEAVLS